MEALLSEAQALVEQPEPLYVLVDMREFSLRNAPQLSDQSPAFEPRSEPAVAVVGGDLLLKLVSNVINSRLARNINQGHAPQVRAFKHEDKAHSWLSVLANGLPT